MKNRDILKQITTIMNNRKDYENQQKYQQQQKFNNHHTTKQISSQLSDFFIQDQYQSSYNRIFPHNDISINMNNFIDGRWQNSPQIDLTQEKNSLNLYKKFSSKIKAFQTGYQNQNKIRIKQYKNMNTNRNLNGKNKQNQIKSSRVHIKKFIQNKNRLKQNNKQNQGNNIKLTYQRLKKYLTPQKFDQNNETQQQTQQLQTQSKISNFLLNQTQSIQFPHKKILRSKQMTMNFDIKNRKITKRSILASTSRSNRNNNFYKQITYKNIVIKNSQNQTSQNIQRTQSSIRFNDKNNMNTTRNVQINNSQRKQNNWTEMKINKKQKINSCADELTSVRSEIYKPQNSRFNDYKSFKTVMSCCKPVNVNPIINVNNIVFEVVHQNDKEKQTNYTTTLNTRRMAFLSRNMREKKLV